ncbi:hypothetical protein QCA50_009141 [Cerrena zonata]|uniref:Uncharacterized protein n=1 Tax=Cerrena zonata TaxID=2478898 RepID=A0AAW0G697_9APHY
MTTSIFFVPSPNSYHSRIRQSLSPRLPSTAPKTRTRSQPSQQRSEKKTLKRNQSITQQVTPPPTPPVVESFETTRISRLKGLLKKPLRRPSFTSHTSSKPAPETSRKVIEKRTELPSPPSTPANEEVKKQIKPVPNFGSRIPRPVRLLVTATPVIRSGEVLENAKETFICTPEVPTTEFIESDVSEDVKSISLSTPFVQFEEVDVTVLARRAAVVSQLSKGLPLSFRAARWVDTSVPSKVLRNRLDLIPDLRRALEESLKKRSQKKTIPKPAPVARPSPVPASPGGIFAELLRKVKPVEGSESLKSHLKKVESVENGSKPENDAEGKRRVRKIQFEADKHPEFLAELKGVLSNRTNTGPTAVKSDRIQIQTDLTDELKTAIAHRKSGSSPEIKVERKSPQPESFQTPLPALRSLANAADKENATRRTSDRITNSSSPAETSRSVASLVNRFSSGTKASFNTHQEPNSSFHPFAGARIRKLNVPELIDTERVSKDKDTQREIEALRIMRRVETGAVSLTKTRVFGGDGPTNACDEERGEGLSLKCVAILEKYRK